MTIENYLCFISQIKLTKNDPYQMLIDAYRFCDNKKNKKRFS